MFFFDFFYLLGPWLLSNLIIFLFFYYNKQFKMLQECHLKLYKSCSNSIPRKFLSVWESTFFFFCDGPIKDVHHKKENKIELQESPQRL